MLAYSSFLSYGLLHLSFTQYWWLLDFWSHLFVLYCLFVLLIPLDSHFSGMTTVKGRFSEVSRLAECNRGQFTWDTGRGNLYLFLDVVCFRQRCQLVNRTCKEPQVWLYQPTGFSDYIDWSRWIGKKCANIKLSHRFLNILLCACIYILYAHTLYTHVSCTHMCAHVSIHICMQTHYICIIYTKYLLFCFSISVDINIILY